MFVEQHNTGKKSQVKTANDNFQKTLEPFQVKSILANPRQYIAGSHDFIRLTKKDPSVHNREIFVPLVLLLPLCGVFNQGRNHGNIQILELRELRVSI